MGTDPYVSIEQQVVATAALSLQIALKNTFLNFI
jgi:hypothetical protein